MPAPLFCSQCAASVPSARRTTDGTSAQLTNQSVPDATVRAGDQPVAVRSENRSVARIAGRLDPAEEHAAARDGELRLRAAGGRG